MIRITPKYEELFNPRNIDDDCDKIADLMSAEANFIREVLEAGFFKQAVTMYLQLMKSMTNHFVEDEHFCYFDDLYSPEYVLQGLYEDIQMHDLDFESSTLLKEGHDEIMQSECYEEYGYPSYL